MTDTDPALTAWRAHLDRLVTADTKAIRPASDDWLPISRDTDRVRARSRRRHVDRLIALHVTPCPTCGKGSPLDTDDCCRCGSSPASWDAAVWAAAAAVRAAS